MSVYGLSKVRDSRWVNCCMHCCLQVAREQDLVFFAKSQDRFSGRIGRHLNTISGKYE